MTPDPGSEARLVAAVCERYGLSPQQIADMTQDQFLTLAEYDTRPGAMAPGVNPADARARLRKMQGKEL